jgi:hypothetical protein
MKLTKYLNNVQSNHREKGIKLSNKVLQAYKNPRYFNRSLLHEIPDDKVNENLIILANDLLNSINTRMEREAEIRPTKRKRKQVASYPEVMGVLEKRFCNLPPFCKSNIYKIKKQVHDG